MTKAMRDTPTELVTREMIAAGIAASDRLALGCASVESQCRAIYIAMQAARSETPEEADLKTLVRASIKLTRVDPDLADEIVRVKVRFQNMQAARSEPVQDDDAELIVTELGAAVDALLSTAEDVQNKAIAAINRLREAIP